MSFVTAAVDTLLVNDLEDAYENMAFGGQYAILLGLFKKEDFSGDAKKVPLKRGLGAGQSATATTAYANAGLAARSAFLVDPFKLYGFSEIDNANNELTKGDNAVVDLMLDESQVAMDSVKMQIDQALAGDGSGCTATISAHSGSGPYTLTLAYQSQQNGLTVGAVYASKISPFDTGLDTGTFTITAKSANTKKITVTAAGGWTPTDTHVFGLSGTVAASASPVVWPGIPGWIVPAASRPVSSALFFNVDRTVDETALAGHYLDGTAGTILEGVNQLAGNIADTPGANPDTVVMSFQNLAKVNASLQSQKRYVEGSTKGPDINVFYHTVVIDGPAGKMDLIGSSNFPSNLVAVLDKSTWVCASPGNKPIKPATSSANPVVEIPGADKALIQYRGLAIVYCTAPGRNGMLTVKA